MSQVNATMYNNLTSIGLEAVYDRVLVKYIILLWVLVKLIVT